MWSRRLFGGVVFAALSACGGGDSTPPVVVDAVTVSPSSLNMAPGQSVTMTATALDNTGAPISGRTAAWTTANSAIATVSATGAVTAVADGVTSITATINGRAGSAAVIVRTPVVSVAVTPATGQLTVGGAPLQLSAVPRDPAGGALTGRTVQWSSANPTIASVSSTGIVTALAAGTASILATSEGVSGTATITVAPDPCTVVRPIAVGETISNSLSANDCRIVDSTAVQRYEFVVTEPTKIEITMNSSAFDAYLFLTNASFAVIAEDDDGGVGVNARILRTIPAGRYFVVANAYDATRFGAYQLTVRTAPAACVIGRPVAISSTTDAVLSSANSCRQNDESFEDRYEVVLGAKSTLTMNLTSTAFDPVLIVMDASERVVVQDDDSGAGLNASLEVQLEAGRYTVLARGYPGETGAYRLAIAPAVNPCAVTRSIGIGQSIGSTFAVTDCALSEGGGPNRYFQRFAFSLPNTTAMQFDMVSSAVDPYLVLQNGVTEEILAENDDASVSTRNARISINLPPGQYIINTTTYNLAEIGFYQLTATGITTAGSVNVTVSPTSLSMQPGQTQQATSNVTGTANSTVNWQSSAPNVASVSSTGFIRALTPGTAVITATAQADPSRSASITVTVGQSDGTTNLDIAAMYLVQSVQQLDGRVPLVADRAAVARVFVRGSRAGLAAATVRVRIVQNASVIGTFTGTATPTLAVDEACCSANISIPLSLIRPGISVLADVDPTNTVTESNENDNAFPLSGTPQALNVVAVPPFNVRFVPVQQNRNGPLGVAQASILGVFQSAWPLSAINATVRTPLVIDYVIGSQNFDDWIRLVRDVEIARQTEGSTSFYYGLVRTRGTSGVLGLANGIPARTAIGVDEGSDFGPTESRLTFAHEMGHTLGLRHAPCGGAAGPDPAYPFADGRTGVYGMDTFNGNVIKLPNATDLMTYCPNQWVSAYNYRKVLDFRQANPNGAGVRAPTDVLMISGSVSRSSVALDPVFSVTAPAVANDETGRMIVEGFDDSDRRLFSYRFSPYAVSDAAADAEAFVVAVPVVAAVQARVARITVREMSGARGNSRVGSPANARTSQSPAADVSVVRAGGGRATMTWSSVQHPAVMVRDRATGEVLALLRNGSTDLAQFGARREIDVLLSHGIGSTSVIINPSTGAIRQ